MRNAAPLSLLVALQAAVSAVSLVVEIVAGRMLAPYVGMSLYTWTSVIAVVLAGFSAGHWWGGRIADGTPDRALRLTGWIMGAAALSTGGALVLLQAVAGPVMNVVAQPVAAIVALTTAVFFLPSLFAGVPAPVLAQIAVSRDSERSGRALGAMFAAGAVGAIAGTLLAGFVFIPWLGSAWTLALVTVIYVLAAVLFLIMAGALRRAGAVALCVAALGLVGLSLARPGPCTRESAYFCIRVIDVASDPARPVNLLVLDHLSHGASARDLPRVMFTEFTAMIDAIARVRMGDGPFSAFFIGGGSYSVPRAWADRGIGPLTVAEIDPAVTEIARESFWFDPEGVTVLHEDARAALLRRPEARYDVIVGDAFGDIAVPAHLVSREFFELVRARLEPGGLFVMNVIDYPDRMQALAAIAAGLQAVFPSVEIWTEATAPVPGAQRVFVLAAGDGPTPVASLMADAPEPTQFAPLADAFVDQLMGRLRPRVLTDDHAPIDRLLARW
ncbi:fused MFS/spermidine synthase [Lutimaribacter marinistellae]|uniref:Fused MFS/spermidine synthase n=1 Tax=Lutimaribacter marinistellae TaxID=1820329 RepID=A0ABV7TA28_9RHOB